MSFSCMYVAVYMCMLCLWRQEKTSDPLELLLHMLVSHASSIGLNKRIAAGLKR